MARRKPRKRRKERINIDTLSNNARKTAALYGLAPLGAQGWDGSDPMVNSSIVVTNPRAARKKETELFR